MAGGEGGTGPDGPGAADPGGGSGAAGRSPGAGERVALDLLPTEVVRRRARGVAVLAVVLAAAAGGLVGLFAGRPAGLLAAAVVAVPLLLLTAAEARRRTWVQDGVVVVRALGVRRVDLGRARRTDLMVSEVRGQRTVSLVLADPNGKTVAVALAVYTAAGGVELGLLALRRLADALAAAGHIVLSGLLVAQLRAEAQGQPMAHRPLYLAAGLVEAGKVLRKVAPQRLAALVSEFS